MGKPVKEFHKYICDATNAHTSLEEYLDSPATAFLKYTIEAKDSIKMCLRKFPKNRNGTYRKDSLDSIQHLTVAVLPAIMGHFETYQRILFAGMFDFSVFLEKFKVESFLKKLDSNANVSIDIKRLAAYRNIGTTSIGSVLADCLSGWHSPEKVNSYFDAFGLENQLFSGKDVKRLKILWQLRHSIVHTGGTLTLPDAQKVDELKIFGGNTLAFGDSFIFEVARKMHPMIKDATKRMGTKYMARLIPNTTSDDRIKIDKLFEVKSSMNVWLT
ncbi:MAG: hypothetical protein JJ975_09830 [Bacteroidia bacterium]|nr:hypothetical protein [Bacteroidia bacterium]